jgi:hypothetical protein
MPHDSLYDPDLTVDLFRLLVHPSGDLDRRLQVAGQRRLREPGVQFGPSRSSRRRSGGSSSIHEE